jgi:hypothetical protein
LNSPPWITRRIPAWKRGINNFKIAVGGVLPELRTWAGIGYNIGYIVAKRNLVRRPVIIGSGNGRGGTRSYAPHGLRGTIYFAQTKYAVINNDTVGYVKGTVVNIIAGTAAIGRFVDCTIFDRY